jgi:hypothetical protein
MKFKRVLQATDKDGEVTIELLGTDESRYAMTLLPEAIPPMLSLLVQGAVNQARARPDVQPGFVLHVTRCQPIVTEGQERGIVLTTADGLELALALEPQALDGLRECVDLARDVRPEGSVH